MKVRVYVSLKPTVLDPQGKTIRAALHGLGYKAISDVRQGKFFELAIEPQTDPERVRQQVEEIAHEVLANPVIEEYRVELLD
ncbi:MAG TPA: phosphoribosylformylglycinamidine synthase subunit PurS [Bryobacteraceae bacterium]|nr:phosphoribosylformylglycinamidine synthase subunit PurS [Bryobacteraceae bacterium]